MKETRAILAAILAAVLYALMTPLAKLMQVNVGPVAEAGLLYLGAGIGMSAICLCQAGMGIRADRPSIGREDFKYVLAMILLDMLAPVFLLLGLSMSNPESVSLLNNFEIAATTIIAVLLFHERAGRKLIVSISLITLSCILLSLESADALQFSKGSLFVLLACVCWGFENNCTRMLSYKNPAQIVIIKGFGSGLGSLILSPIIGEHYFHIGYIALAMLLGFVAYGLSIYFYIYAQRDLGAAKTSTYYAISPFIGAGLSLVIFGEMPSFMFMIALVIMAMGTYFASAGDE